MQDWNKLKTLLKNSSRILVTTHAKCDGDALGSELALAAALRHKGFFVSAVNPDLPADNFQFIGKDFSDIRMYDGSEAKQNENCTKKLSPKEAATYDTLIIVDTSARAQLRKMADIADSGMKTIVIDHHLIADTLTPHTFADASQPAAGSLVMELIEFLGVPLNLCESGSACSIADFLFLAIATDTGWFRFPATQPSTMMQAAKLMAEGASTSRLYQCAYENYSPARLKLLGQTADRSVLECGGRLAYSTLRQEDFVHLSATLNDTTNLVNCMMMTGSVEVAALFTETEKGKIRLNFRSRGSLNVAEIARLYGGGGHKNAAGGTFEALSFQEGVQTIVDVLKERMMQKEK